MDIDSLSVLRENLRHEVLGRDEELDLIQRAQAGDADAKDRLLACNERLIFNIVLRYYRSGICGDAELADLQQEGRIGFLKAVERFDTQSGNRLSTYAHWWIRQSVLREGAVNGQTITISAKHNEKRMLIYSTLESLRKMLGRKPTLDEIAQETGLKLEDVSLAFASKVQSLDEDENDEKNQYELIPDKSVDVENDVFGGMSADILNAGLNSLLPRSKVIIEQLYGLNGYREHTFAEVANRFQCSKQRIQQIRDVTLTQLREYFTKNGTVA